MPRDATTITRYEPCPDCTDGSCGSCGSASSDNAAPGIRLGVRRVRFVRCCKSGCGQCGANAHPMAAPGVKVEVIDEYGAKRWVPSIHKRVEGRAGCPTPHVPEDQLTDDDAAVTCKRCQRTGKRRPA